MEGNQFKLRDAIFNIYVTVFYWEEAQERIVIIWCFCRATITPDGETTQNESLIINLMESIRWSYAQWVFNRVGYRITEQHTFTMNVVPYFKPSVGYECETLMFPVFERLLQTIPIF